MRLGLLIFPITFVFYALHYLVPPMEVQCPPCDLPEDPTWKAYFLGFYTIVMFLLLVISLMAKRIKTLSRMAREDDSTFDIWIGISITAILIGWEIAKEIAGINFTDHPLDNAMMIVWISATVFCSVWWFYIQYRNRNLYE